MKPSLPQGTRDFGPDIVRKRNFIFNTIRSVFELYGFQPLETPALENLETLMGKYGEEGDKLIFKILNNGLDHPGKSDQAREDFEKILSGKNTKGITERALRYDLTIPFARYVAMNHNQLVFPFKRYQLQPVWRADRPQKGRYREFYQCDADVVGSKALINEVELALIYHHAFTRLGIKEYELRINHRKLLTALAELCGGPDKLIDITVAIDKLDKIGLTGVKEELARKGLSAEQSAVITQMIGISETHSQHNDKVAALTELFRENTNGLDGIREMEFVIRQVKSAVPEARLSIDTSLARGLNYYTGIIFEAKAPPAVKMGSIGGGGRYDDLTGLFGVPGIPGVGISFGVDRIYDVMDELELFADQVETGTQALFFNMGETESQSAFALMQDLRNSNIRCELYPEQTKLDKQFKYAERKNIPFVIIIGERELTEKSVVIKDTRTGVQTTLNAAELVHFTFE
jgi:histidyl-tRNA synthetase